MLKWLNLQWPTDTRCPKQEAAINGFRVRVLFVFLCLISAWLFGHFYLTKRHDITTWKLGGMAMYIAAGPHYGLNWQQRFGGETYGMSIGEHDLEELFERKTDEAFITSFGTLLGMELPARYLMHTRNAPYPVIARLKREKFVSNRKRYIDRSCQYEMIYVGGDMLQNRICRSLEEAIVTLE